MKKQILWLSKNYLALLLFFSSYYLVSCHKEPIIEPKLINEASASDPAVILPDPRDSAYYWIKEYYLWTELLPSFEVFRPHDLPDIFAVMAKVRSYQPLDRFSFVERKSDPILRETDLVVDMGFSIKYNPGTADLRVSFVNRDSPAGLAGVQRGWRIISIDGRNIVGSSEAEIAFLNDVFRGTTPVHLFRFQKLDNSVVDLTIREGVYRSHTVLYRNVYQTGRQSIGYMVYNNFGGSTSVTELQNTAGYFESMGVTDLIVDLRYNRGGFVSTAEFFANLLAPLSVGSGNRVMFRYVFNSRHTEHNQTIYFNKTGTLNPSRIVFIVTPSTASASELLINALSPVIDIKLIGDRHTYGKPVGFFPISVYEYNIYPVSFKTVNSNGRADYYAGFSVDQQVTDDLYHDFGDQQEACLREALSYLGTGSFTRMPAAAAAIRAISPEIAAANQKLDLKPALSIENRPSRVPMHH